MIPDKKSVSVLTAAILLVLFPYSLAEGIINGVPEHVNATDVLERIEKGLPVNLDNVIIDGDLDVSNLNLPIIAIERSYSETAWGGISENLWVISAPIRITNSVINGSVSFNNALFRDTVEFDSTIFNDNVEFRGNILDGETRFIGTQFKRFTSFICTKFNNNVTYFVNATFLHNADFRETKFNGHGSFGIAKFRGVVLFSDAEFNETAFFQNAKFDGKAIFERCRFNGSADFSLAEFGDDAEFVDSSFNSSIYLYKMIFKRLAVKWSSISDGLETDSSTYLSLINNFKVLGQFEDADNCYYQYRKWIQNKRNWGFNRDGLYKFIDNISCISFGYGVRPGNAIILSIELIIILGVLYWLSNGIYKSSTPKTKRENISIWSISRCYNNLSRKAILLTIPSELPKNSRLMLKIKKNMWFIIKSTQQAILNLWNKPFIMQLSLGDALYFSTMVFVSRPPQFWFPRGKWRYLVMIEGIMGWMLLALFIVALTRTTVRY